MAKGTNPGVKIPGPGEASPAVRTALQQIVTKLGFLASPAFAGLTVNGETVSDTLIGQWNTAYGWGDHAGLYDPVGTAAGEIGDHEIAYDHTKLHDAVTLGTANGLSLTGQELSLPTTATPTFANVLVPDDGAFKSSGTGIVRIGNSSGGLFEVGGDAATSILSARDNDLQFAWKRTSTDVNQYIYLRGTNVAGAVQTYLTCYGHESIVAGSAVVYASVPFEVRKNAPAITLKDTRSIGPWSSNTLLGSLDVYTSDTSSSGGRTGVGVIGGFRSYNMSTNNIPSADLRFYTAEYNQMATERFRITPPGLFLIGKTSGTEALEVAGKIRSDSAFNLNGTDGVSDSNAGVPTALTVSGGIVTAVTKNDWLDQSVKQAATPTFAGVNLSGPITVDIEGSGQALTLKKYIDAATFNTLQCYAARGTRSTPAAIQANDLIFQFLGYGYGATGFSAASRVKFGFYAEENWTDTAQGAYYAVETTPSGSTTRAVRLKLSGDGKLTVGSVAAGLLGSHVLAVRGPNASTTAYPSFNLYTDGDNYPLISFLPFAHDNVQLRFDSYWDGSANDEISSSANSTFRLTKRAHYLSLEAKDVTAQGEAFDLWHSGLAITKENNVALFEESLGSPAISFGTNAVHVLSINAGTAPTTSIANKVQLWSADRGATAGKCGLHIRAEDGTSHVFSDFVGIGTVSPQVLIDVHHPTVNGFLMLSSYYGNLTSRTTAVVGRLAGGTPGSETGTPANQNMLVFGGRGHTGSEWETLNRSTINFRTEELHSTTAQGSGILFATTACGSTTRADVAWLGGNGRLFVGASANKDSAQEKIHTDGKIRADTAFNVNGTDGVTQASAAGKVSDVTSLAGGIATAQTQVTPIADGAHSLAGITSITTVNGRITAMA